MNPLSRGAQLGWIIDDQPDAARTMQTMAGLCRHAVDNPAVVRYANEIIENNRSRDYTAQVSTLNAFGIRYFKFLNNPVGVQRIRTPLDMLQDIERKGFVWGACDDAAVLMATLGMADALNARFRAVAFGHGAQDPNAPLTHVICDLWDGQQWCPLDITKPDDLLRLPDVVRTLTLDI